MGNKEMCQSHNCFDNKYRNNVLFQLDRKHEIHNFQPVITEVIIQSTKVISLEVSWLGTMNRKLHGDITGVLL